MPSGLQSRARTSARRSARVAVVVSRFNATITDRLLEGATATCVSRTGGAPTVYCAPGSFELPVIALSAARSGRFDAVVALGCLIKGETSHDRYIAEAVAHGLVQVSMLTGIPATFGVLTVDTPAQAEARAGGDHGNKGADAMNAAIDSVEVTAAARTGRSVVAVSSRALPDKARRGGRRSA